MMKNLSRPHWRAGFTLIELLITIAVMSIMAALMISSYSNAATDTNRVVARQQQAAVQTAVNAWINRPGEGGTDGGGRVSINTATNVVKPLTLAEIQEDWNSRVTSLARLNLVSGYLEGSSVSEFTDPSLTVNSDRIKSKALAAAKKYIQLPNWNTNNYPQVLLLDD